MPRLKHWPICGAMFVNKKLSSVRFWLFLKSAAEA
jgi:hypothetical protein